MKKLMVVYKITNKINGKFYIGSTINFQDRQKGHFRDLAKQTHHSFILQSAYNKYGEVNFFFETIETIVDVGDLRNKEQHYIDTLKPAYNVSKDVWYRKGVPSSPEARERGRIARMRPVTQFDLDGNVIKFWNGAADAERELKIKGVTTGCSGLTKTTYGFHFEYTDTEWVYKPKRKIQTEEALQDLKKIQSSNFSKTYKVTDIKENVYFIKHLKNFCKYNKLPYDAVPAYMTYGKTYKGLKIELWTDEVENLINYCTETKNLNLVKEIKRSDARVLTYKGVTKTLVEWCEEFN